MNHVAVNKKMRGIAGARPQSETCCSLMQKYLLCDGIKKITRTNLLVLYQDL